MIDAILNPSVVAGLKKGKYMCIFTGDWNLKEQDAKDVQTQTIAKLT